MQPVLATQDNDCPPSKQPPGQRNPYQDGHHFGSPHKQGKRGGNCSPEENTLRFQIHFATLRRETTYSPCKPDALRCYLFPHNFRLSTLNFQLLTAFFPSNVIT